MGLFSRREKVRFIFSCFDSNKDGRLSQEELQQLLLTINKKLQTSSYSQVEQAVEKVYEVGGQMGWNTPTLQADMARG